MNKKILNEAWSDAIVGKYLVLEIIFFILLVILFHFISFR